MRLLALIALMMLPACGNTYHPEYHPVTSVKYTQTVGVPVSAGAQPVVVAPPWLAPPPPIAIPSPPPPDMEW